MSKKEYAYEQLIDKIMMCAVYAKCEVSFTRGRKFDEYEEPKDREAAMIKQLSGKRDVFVHDLLSLMEELNKIQFEVKIQ